MSTKSIEIIGKYIGHKMHFENRDGSILVIGQVRLADHSHDFAKAAGVDPYGFLTVKGNANLDDLETNQTYLFSGRFQEYENKRFNTTEMQFAFRSVTLHIPHTPEGLADYIANNGRGLGIGPSKAKRIVEKLGVDSALEVCYSDPEQIAKIASIELEQANRFCQRMIEKRNTAHTRLELDRLLTGKGFSKTLPDRIIKAWGVAAAEQIVADPYSLMQFRGVGFKLTDKLWIDLGKSPTDIRRQALAAWYGMASNTDGHTWFDATSVHRFMLSQIGSGVDFQPAILYGKQIGQQSPESYGAIATIRTDETGRLAECGKTVWLAEGKHAAAEQFVAEAIAAAMHERSATHLTRFASFEHLTLEVLKHATCRRCGRQLTAPTVHVLDDAPYGPTCIGYVDPADAHTVYELKDWLAKNPKVNRFIETLPAGIIKLPQVCLWPDPSTIPGISDHQREQVAKAMEGRIGLLGGSPGTGKTFTLAALIKAIWRSGLVGLHEIGIGAPTGKAAVRLTQALEANGVPIRARTWHSLLGVGGEGETDSDGWSFIHGLDNPWPYKIIFGDESSMPTVDMMASIFRARANGCHMLFVGDVNQLPPVGNGAPFRDMIAAGLPYGELREIKRNSGGIVEACASIRDRSPWVETYIEPPAFSGLNLWITDDRGDEAKIKRIIDLLHEESQGGLDPVWDCQVLVALNEKSKLSRVALNTLLQDTFNHSPKVNGTPFREGDKVVCLKNGFYKPDARSQHDIDDTNKNGELYVANGELGRVIEIQEKAYIIAMELGNRTVQVFRSKVNEDGEEVKATGCNWDLGYALTVHKYQGSEQRVIVGVIDSAGGRICDRAFVYTLISRAKDRCYLVGESWLASKFCDRQQMDQRKTFLANRIQLAMFEQEASEL